MTREEILAMEAGQEMDELVAMEVMGWTCGDHPELNGSGQMMAEYEFEVFFKSDGTFVSILDWEPSTDISVSWDMEEKIIELGKEDDYGFELYLITGAEERTPERININVFKIAHASALQRCKASLLAVMGL